MLLCVATCEAANDDEVPCSIDRRQFLSASLLLIGWRPCVALADSSIVPVKIQPQLAPDQRSYDPSDERLREAAQLLQKALNATDVQTEEALWTELIEKYGRVDANWVPDVVGRAWGNRGNARSRQGKLDQALSDYNEAIRICPWSVDPVLNRGVILETQGRFEEAIRDYRAVLDAEPNDPSAWNNLGNASGGLGRWKEAVEYYGKAAVLAPAFSFAVANRALAMYQLGQTNESIREMRTLLRRYPDFDDMRAALAAALWEADKLGDAETNWGRVGDPRYKDKQWLRTKRRWPPRILADLEAFLDIRRVPEASA
ncbi:hypothetical protein WJX72_000888 [[Myrmecia] bisecta]|uniref:Tetratricopeptide repeat protein n=1 Tax=[Myrmecia] bisecta TaxID=41462 RepID=A0AAW1Q9U0_9CHLO